MPQDKKVGVPSGLGVPLNVPLIGGGQKVSVDEVLQKLMQNIHELNTDYQSFIKIINELSTRVALLESRTSAVENKQVAFPKEIKVVVKQEEK